MITRCIELNMVRLSLQENSLYSIFYKDDHEVAYLGFCYGGRDMILPSFPAFKARGLKIGLRKILHIRYLQHMGEIDSFDPPP